ncbi:flagellar motor switch protein FliG [Sphingomonas jejuensis]|uniref:Flagellar motor switch protein FliG n=1 Tax=Sphingomonas jejuensis TaxID=904715 RepID=A0ABX0XPS9_9SPHN|nr:flagellar motor switch protein FliG [Sphingomonas jejuensis]NJC34727.1 flagellar motor switch protein FliG [Sphingomonas jejuensis]
MDAAAEVKPMSGVERAAVLMMLVGEEEAAAILQKLEPDEVRQLGTAMFAVADVAEPQVAGVLDDFVAKAKDRTAIGFDPRPKIQGMMTRALGPDKADSVLARITPREEACAIDLLDWMEAGEIAAIVAAEHPQVAAVIVANLDPAVAADVLQALPDAQQPDILHRVAKLGPVPNDAIDLLKTVLAGRAGQARTPAAIPLGGTREAAAIMNNARRATEQKVMPKLHKLDKDVARAIEEEMFVFENLLDMDDKNLGTLIRGISADTLGLALKGVEEAQRGRFLGCMSARAADGIRDEMEARGPVRLSEALEAQKAILVTARQMAKDGLIMLSSKDDDFV